jgi:membrane dipeptidase
MKYLSTFLARLTHLRITTVFVMVLLLSGCGDKKPVDRMSDEALRAYADTLAHRYLITDGHVDLPFRLKVKNFRIEREYMGIPIESAEGDFDYVRARKGGLDAPFMSIYIPAGYQQLPDMGRVLADSMINMVQGIATHLPDKFALANTTEELQQNFKAGKISLPMGMENGATPARKHRRRIMNLAPGPLIFLRAFSYSARAR